MGFPRSRTLCSSDLGKVAESRSLSLKVLNSQCMWDETLTVNSKFSITLYHEFTR
jgi:hypothetical protein